MTLVPHDFFEKTVTSFPSLAKEVSLLDLDSGIRTFADYGGKKRQLVFITRSPNDAYTLMVYGRKTVKGEPAAGDRLLVKEFHSERELTRFIEGFLSKPVKAFVY